MGRTAPSAGDAITRSIRVSCSSADAPTLSFTIKFLGPAVLTGMRRIQVPSLAMRVEALPILTVKAPGESSVPLTVSWRLAGALWFGSGWGER